MRYRSRDMTSSEVIQRLKKLLCTDGSVRNFNTNISFMGNYSLDYIVMLAYINM